MINPDATIERRLLNAAMHALRSYQYDNGSKELAEAVANDIERCLKAESGDMKFCGFKYDINNPTAPQRQSDSMSEKLKPCSFCGSEDIDPQGVAYRKFQDKVHKIYHKPACNNCSATSDDWNARSAPKTADLEYMKFPKPNDELGYTAGYNAAIDAVLKYYKGYIIA